MNVFYSFYQFLTNICPKKCLILKTLTVTQCTQPGSALAIPFRKFHFILSEYSVSQHIFLQCIQTSYTYQVFEKLNGLLKNIIYLTIVNIDLNTIEQLLLHWQSLDIVRYGHILLWQGSSLNFCPNTASYSGFLPQSQNTVSFIGLFKLPLRLRMCIHTLSVSVLPYDGLAACPGCTPLELPFPGMRCL